MLSNVLDIVSAIQVGADYYYYHHHCHHHLVDGILSVFLCNYPMEYQYPCFTHEETKTQGG